MPELPRFKTPELLLQALTHTSYLNEHPGGGEDNERLEFLGDATLGFLVGAMLYQRFPQMPEGELTRWRSHLVDQTQLARLATELNLGSHLRLGRGVEKEGGRSNPSLLSSAFEAVLGAYFLDAGVEAVREYVEALWIPVIQDGVEGLSQTGKGLPTPIDAKSLFQQWALANLGPQNPIYVVTEAVGPDHAKLFTVAVMVGNTIYGMGTDRSKAEAGKRAAEAALKSLGLDA